MVVVVATVVIVVVYYSCKYNWMIFLKTFRKPQRLTCLSYFINFWISFCRRNAINSPDISVWTPWSHFFPPNFFKPSHFSRFLEALYVKEIPAYAPSSWNCAMYYSAGAAVPISVLLRRTSQCWKRDYWVFFFSDVITDNKYVKQNLVLHSCAVGPIRIIYVIFALFDAHTRTPARPHTHQLFLT